MILLVSLYIAWFFLYIYLKSITIRKSAHCCKSAYCHPSPDYVSGIGGDGASRTINDFGVLFKDLPVRGGKDGGGDTAMEE